MRATITTAMTVGMLAAGTQVAHAAAWLPAVPVTGTTNCSFLLPAPSIAETGDGTTIATWQERDDLCVGTTRVAAAVRAPGAAGFSAAILLSNAAAEATEPQIAVDASGAAIVVWSEAGTIRYSLRTPGAAFTPAQTISGSGPASGRPDVALGGGTAVVSWVDTGVTQIAVKPNGGNSFGAVTPFPVATELAADVDVAVNASGDALVSWQTIGGVVDTLRVAARPVGGAFTQPAPIFTTNIDLDHIDHPLVAIDPAGRGTVLFGYFDFAARSEVLKTAARNAGGDFGAAVNVTDPAVNAAPLGSFDLAVDPSNTAVAVWWQSSMRAAVRPSGGSFGPSIASGAMANFVITRPSVRFGPGGRATAVWLNPGAGSFAVQSAVLAAGATSFEPVANAASVQFADGDRLDGPTPVGVDGEGNAASIWRRQFDASPAPGFQLGFRLDSAIYDAAGPTLTSVNIPSEGPLQLPVGMSVTAVDRWSAIASTTWDFGDGTTGSGASTTHAWARGGTYVVRVTTTDAAGNPTSASSKIEIPSAPSPELLAIDGLKISPRLFRAALSGPTVRVGNLKPWSRVTYEVNVASKVFFSFERPSFGRTVGKRCVKQSKGNRTNKRCIRYLPVKGSFTRTRPKGGDRFTFTGRLLGHRLKAGRYRLIARATAGGASGASKRVAFQIRPAAKKKQ